MMQEDNQKEKNQEQESWSEHFFAEMKNDENYAREEENEKERTSSYRTYLEQKRGRKQKIDSILRTFYFNFFWWCVVWDLQRFRIIRK